MGTVFMRRFRTITIDYPRKMIYFELPQKINSNIEELYYNRVEVDP